MSTSSISGKTNQKMFDDVWWMLCHPDGRGVLKGLIAETVKGILPSQPHRYVKGDKDGTVYELDKGKLRGLTGLEWDVLGFPKPAVFPQAKIDQMPKED